MDRRAAVPPTVALTADAESQIPPAAPSLRRTLLAWLAAPLVLALPAGALLQFWLLAPIVDAGFDHALDEVALALTAQVRAGPDGPSFSIAPDAEYSLRADPYDAVYFAVLAPGGRLIGGDAALALRLPGLAHGEDGAIDHVLGGLPVRVLAREFACGNARCEVRVAETVFKRQRLQRDAALVLSAAVLVLVALAAVALWFAVTRALRPLGELDQQMARRSLQDLRPLDAPQAPREVQPVLLAMNRLFARLRRAARAQQAFIADAAHQLRTPLTTLQTESELALAEPQPPAVRAMLERLHEGTTRAARLAGQLLVQARSEASSDARDAEPVDLRALAGELAQEWVPRAIAGGIDLGFELAPAPASGHGFLLREALANLLHNALEYAGRGARVTVRTGSVGARAFLEVEDSGPGIPERERERVLERFYRPPGSPGLGSGLGLAIVHDVARLHGATLELREGAGGRGLCVRIAFTALAV